MHWRLKTQGAQPRKLWLLSGYAIIKLQTISASIQGPTIADCHRGHLISASRALEVSDCVSMHLKRLKNWEKANIKRVF